MLGNFAQPPNDWEHRKMTPMDAMVYPLGRPQDVAAIKGELCMAFKPFFISGAGYLPSPEVTTTGNGLTKTQLLNLTFAGQILTPGESLGTGDNTTAVVTCGPVTIVNTGADTIPAGSGVILDDPEVVEEGGVLHPRFVDPGVESEKFLFTTRPFRMGAHLAVFQRLTKRIMDKCISMGDDVTYEQLWAQVKNYWKDGSICLSDVSQSRCPLRRYSMYLCDDLTRTGLAREHTEEYDYQVDEEIARDFNRAYSGCRIPGTMTGVAPVVPADSSDRIAITGANAVCFPIRMFAEFIELLRRRFVGVALTDMRRGESGHVLLSYKNF